MFHLLPDEITRKIISLLPHLSLMHASSVCTSVRQLNLSHLLLPIAYEGYISMNELDHMRPNEIKSTREMMHRCCARYYDRIGANFGISGWRIFIQELIHTIDMMICKNDCTFNDPEKVYITGGTNLVSFYTSIFRQSSRYIQPTHHISTFNKARLLGGRDIPSVDDLAHYNINKEQQLSFNALVY